MISQKELSDIIEKEFHALYKFTPETQNLVNDMCIKVIEERKKRDEKISQTMRRMCMELNDIASSNKPSKYLLSLLTPLSRRILTQITNKVNTINLNKLIINAVDYFPNYPEIYLVYCMNGLNDKGSNLLNETNERINKFMDEVSKFKQSRNKILIFVLVVLVIICSLICVKKCKNSVEKFKQKNRVRITRKPNLKNSKRPPHIF